MAKDQFDKSTGELFPMFITAYSSKIKVDLDCSDLPSLAQQNFRDECDINNIMSKFEATGLLEHVAKYNGNYGDFSNLEDYQTSINLVREANEAFDSLDAATRRQFDNDPAKFLAFVETADRDQLLSAGLIDPAAAIPSSAQSEQVPDPKDPS